MKRPTPTTSLTLITLATAALLTMGCSTRATGTLAGVAPAASNAPTHGPILSDDAGGSDRGGGGTTNPHPVDPELIAAAVTEKSRPILIPWLTQAEIHFHNLSAADQLKSPMVKLFAKPGQIIELVKTTKVELRFSKACMDKNGKSWDGSIYASEPGAICLSPSAMAPKLNVYNVDQETVALVLHELSHLVGTTEPEARAIQSIALADFVTFNFQDVIWAQTNMAGDSGSLPQLINLIRNPLRQSGELAAEDMAEAFAQFGTIQVNLSYGDNLNFVNAEEFDFANSLNPRFYLARDWSCANDSDRSAKAQAACQANLNRAFAGQPTQSAKIFEQAYDGAGASQDMNYDYQIRNPANLTEFRGELNALADDLQKLEDFLADRCLVKTQVIRK